MYALTDVMGLTGWHSIVMHALADYTWIHNLHVIQITWASQITSWKPSKSVDICLNIWSGRLNCLLNLY